MNLPAITPRVAELREKYMKCPMMTKKLSYSKSARQWLDMKRGWTKYASEPDLYLRRALAEAYVTESMKPVIIEGELIVGQPDFTPLDESEQVEYGEKWDFPGTPGRTDHMSLDFEKLLRIGVDGLIAEIEAKPNYAENHFYVGALAELRALLKLAEKYVAKARELGMNDVADVLERVPAKPATTFREALQSIHFYSFGLWGLYQAGRPDRYLIDYYRRDLERGILTPESAQELIDCFCLMYTTYILSSSSVGFMIGGRDRDGNPVENELTWLFLNSIPHTRTADPSIGLCVTDETSPELLLKASEIISEGCTHPAFYGDRMISESLRKNGATEGDSHDYVHCCCVEITVGSKSSVWTVSPYYNCLAMLLEVLKSHEDAENLDEIIAHFAELLREKVLAGAEQENRWQAHRATYGGEPLRVSCLVDDCISRGKCINEGGAVYNEIQPNFLGIFNVVDSLAAIQTLVFEDKSLTLHELNEILDANFVGHEALRDRINSRIVHFGNNEEFTNELARRITGIIAKACEGFTTFRGDKLVPAAFSYNEHVKHGSRTPASPDGRLAGEALCDGTNPVQGHDFDGPTSMLLSTLSWEQSPFLGGIAVNLELTESQARPEVVKSLVETYIKGGGMEIQINVVDRATLEDAKKNPEKHSNLLVRVGGYSDYFTSVSPALQDEIIKRNRY